MGKSDLIKKHNIKIYFWYVIFGSDLLFYYGTRVLYLSEVKGISDSNIVFLSTIFSFAAILGIIFGNILNNKTTNKKTLIIGDCISIVSLALFILGRGFLEMIISQILTAIGFTLKNISLAPLLQESIQKEENKSKVFSNIDGKAYFAYCICSSISILLAGYLYEINKNIPAILSFICAIIALVLSASFYDIKTENKTTLKESIKGIKECFIFFIHSKRMKALLLSLGFIWGIFVLYGTYQTTLLKNLNVSAGYIGIIVMILDLIRGFGGRMEYIYNKKNSNRSLTKLSLLVSLSFISAGLGTVLKIPFIWQIIIVILAYFIIDIMRGIYMVLYKRYINSFTNTKVLPSIYSLTNIYWNISRIIITGIGSFILTKANIKISYIIMGIFFLILTVLIGVYMSSRVGLKPEEYEKVDIKYAEK